MYDLYTRDRNCDNYYPSVNGYGGGYGNNRKKDWQRPYYGKFMFYFSLGWYCLRHVRPPSQIGLHRGSPLGSIGSRKEFGTLALNLQASSTPSIYD